MELQDQMLLTVTTKSGRALTFNVDVMERQEGLEAEGEVRVCVNESAEGFIIVVGLEDLTPKTPLGQRAWANAVATGSAR
jgi:hypothetical protein